MTTPATAKSPPSRPPESDDGIGYPYAPDVLPPKSMFHFVPQAYMQGALETWLDDPTTLIASQMFIYYEPGNPRVNVAPDVYIIPNVGSALRRSYFLWLEHEVPTFAMEIASSSTYRNDGGFKYRLYESWGGAGILALRSGRRTVYAAVARLSAGGRTLHAYSGC